MFEVQTTESIISRLGNLLRQQLLADRASGGLCLQHNRQHNRHLPVRVRVPLPGGLQRRVALHPAILDLRPVWHVLAPVLLLLL